MGKQLYRKFLRERNKILQSACMLLVCFSLLAGEAQNVQAALSSTTTTPVLESIEVIGNDVVLTWSQPETVYGAPSGGYDTFIDGVDQNNHLAGLSTTIKGLAPGEHTFQVEARYLQTREFNRSNVVSVLLPDSTPPVPEEPSVSNSTTTPVLQAAEVIGGNVILTWSQPATVYGAPDGGYDTFIDGVDQNNHLQGLSTTVTGLAPGEHTFQVEARYTETRPKEFNRSNVVTVILEDSTPTAPEEPAQPEEPSVSQNATTPVLQSVEMIGSDVVLTWSQPATVYGAPDGGYDTFINGVDQNNHLKGLSTTVSGLAPGEHTFQVEARYTETSPKEFNRSNVVTVMLEGSTPTIPEEPAQPEEPALSDSTTTPVLESVQVNGSDFDLTWSQPASVYGAPDGGYDIFIDGVDQNNHLEGFSTTISGLAPGEHTFQVEARYMETREFNRSNVVSAVSEGSTPTVPEEPTAPEEPTEPTLPSQITLAWDPGTDPQVIGYRLYYKESSANDPSYNVPPFDSTGLGGSPIDIGLNETYTLNLPYDTTVYCFAVTAFNSDGLESGLSNVVCTQ